MAQVLEGVRVLDLSRVVSGPWCTQILADLGAEVIKIERPGRGDDTRQMGPFLPDADGAPTNDSAIYLTCNRGKQSVTLDIADPAGRGAIVRELAASCDVFVENFKGGALARNSGWTTKASAPCGPTSCIVRSRASATPAPTRTGRPTTSSCRRCRA